MRSTPRLVPVSALLVGAALVFHEPARAALLSVLRFPFTAARSAVTALLSLPRLPSLASEHAELKAALLQQQLELTALRERLHAAQHTDALSRMSPARGVVADVIGRSPLPTQQTLLLNRGRRDGLVLDSVVLDVSGVVGRVTELQPSTALVLLLTDPDSRVAAIIERSRETGLLTGQGRGQCQLIYLDAHADVAEGDRVVTAGLGGAFPKGLLLGSVTRVVRDETFGVASAWVVPAVRVGQLEEVLCLPAVRP